MGSDKVQKAFDAFDTDKSGELDLNEFREAINSLGMTLTDKQFLEVRFLSFHSLSSLYLFFFL